MSSLLEDVRGMMPGHARSNWSLTEKKVDIAAVEKEWDSLLTKYDDALKSQDLKTADQALKGLKALQEPMMTYDPKRQGMRSYVNIVTHRSQQLQRLKKAKSESVEALEERSRSSAEQDEIDAASMEKHRVKWRTSPTSHHKLGFDEEGDLVKGNPHHPLMVKAKGGEQLGLFDKSKGGKESTPHTEPKAGSKAALKTGADGGEEEWTVTKSKKGEMFDGTSVHSMEIKSGSTGKTHKANYFPDKKEIRIAPHSSLTPGFSKGHHTGVTFKEGSESVSRSVARLRLAEARQKFEGQDRMQAIHQQIAEIRDTIHRGPSWSYPDWALPPKTEFSEEG